ncbi:MAG: vWA domain-containing protein [Persicimonas sp.]
MFINFLYHLRSRGLPISTTEFLALIDALEKGLARGSLEHFYVVARSVLIKRPEHYDIYDQAFAEFFEDAEFDASLLDGLHDELMRWLEDPKAPPQLSPEELAELKKLGLDELREEFEKRLAEQDERHDGGSHWIGTGGKSPFGHSGQNPAGVRVGGKSGNRSAVQVASKRRFRNLRKDLTLDVRDIGMALRRLRQLTREGNEEKLDLEATIDKTAKNAGYIDLVFRPPRENNVKLLLLCDVGGSMNPYTRLTSRLFSAAHQASHFKSFESYYFHNCPYETLYTDMAQKEGRPTEEVFRNLDRTWRCIVVGDAAMAPTELTQAGGSVDYWHYNDKPGIDYLRQLRDTIPRTVWLNPDKPKWWGSWTTRTIQELFNMYPFTMQGLEDAVDELRRRS